MIWLIIIALVLFGFCILFVYECKKHAEKILKEKPVRSYYLELSNKIDFSPLEKISEHIHKLIIIMEDPKFYRHHGFDWLSILRAIKYNVFHWGYKKGASTITQQLAKNMYLSFEKTMFRKIVEFFIAVNIEKELSKKEILEFYLNIIDYGNNCYGITPASKLYFKKTPAELDFEESLILCSLLPAPSKYNPLSPYRQLSIKLARDKEMLKRMGVIK